jgi:streptogramin lyase
VNSSDSEVWGPDGAPPADDQSHPVEPALLQQFETESEPSSGTPSRRWAVVPVAMVLLAAVVVASRVVRCDREVKPAVAIAITPLRNDPLGWKPLAKFRMHDYSVVAGAPDGALYVSDPSARVVYQIDTKAKQVRIVAGSRVGPDSAASVLANPRLIAVDSKNRLVIVDGATRSTPSRIIRVTTSVASDAVESELLGSDDRPIDELYIDYRDRVLLTPEHLMYSELRRPIVRFTDAQRQESTVELGLQLLLYPNGSSFLYDFEQGVKPIKLFGEATVDRAPQLAARAQGRQHLTLAGSSLFRWNCPRFGDSACELQRLNLPSPVRSASPITDIKRPDSLRSVGPVGGGLVMASWSGALVVIPDRNALAKQELVVSSPEKVPVERIENPIDSAAKLSSPTVGPDGTIYALHWAGRSSLLVVETNGDVRRIAVDKTLGDINEIQATANGLVMNRFDAEGSQRTELIPYGTALLQVAAGVRAPLPLPLANVAHFDGLTSDDAGQLVWQKENQNGTRSVFRLNPGDSRDDPARPELLNSEPMQGFGPFVYCDETHSSLGDLAFDSSVTVPNYPERQDEWESADAQAPDNRLTSVGPIASLGQCRLVVSNRAGTRLSLAKRGQDGTWMIERFGPRLIEQSPLAARTAQFGQLGLAAAPDGSVVLVSAHGVMRRVRANGQVTILFGGGSQHPSFFTSSRGIALAPGVGSADLPSLLVADVEGNRIVEAMADGRNRYVDIRTDIANQPSAAPSAVAVGPDRKLYIVSSATHQVHRFDPGDEQRKLVRIVGFVNSGKGEGLNASVQALNNPTAVAVGANGTAYVSDTGNNRVIAVNSKGELSTILNARDPMGLAVIRGSLMVATADGVMMIDLATNITEPIVMQSGTLPKLTNPTCLTFGPDHSLYVCEPTTGSIWRITPSGKQTLLFRSETAKTIHGVVIDGRIGFRFTTDAQVWEIAPKELDRVASGWNRLPQ